MILNHVRLIPAVSGGIGTDDGYVNITGDRITEVSVTASSDPEAVDCGGKTLIPGLIDLHTHIGMGMANKGGFFPEGDPMYVLSRYAAQVRSYLKHGFTTVRDCGSPMRAAVYTREMIRDNVIPGPDVLACGSEITSSLYAPDRYDSDEGIVAADGPYEMRKAVHKEVSKGVDFIKIYASGSAGDPKGHPTHPIMFFDEIRAAVETAEMHDTYVAAHCHADSAVRACIDAGVHTLEHCTYMSDDTIEYLKTKPETCLVPTLAACFVSQEDPEERAFWLARLTPMLEYEGEVIRKAYEAGLKIGYGTDSGGSSKQYQQGIEFEYRKQYCHMSDLDLLLQATKHAAEIVYIDGEVGTVEKGKKANLVLADGKPDEDISVLYKKEITVYKSGKKVEF